MKQSHTVEWVSKNRKAKCHPNPSYPHGIDLDIHGDVEKCHVTIPYPASECGTWIIRCEACDLTVGVTAAGRPDDPRSYKMPCKINNKKGDNNVQ